MGLFPISHLMRTTSFDMVYRILLEILLEIPPILIKSVST